MTGLNKILHVDSVNYTTTVQAGVPLGELVNELAEHGLELAGSYDLSGRTVGGAVAAPCFGPTIGNSGSFFSSNVISLKLVRADGQVVRVGASQSNLINAFRSSLGPNAAPPEAPRRPAPYRQTGPKTGHAH